MKNFIITTDTTCDLPAEYIRSHGIGMLSLTYTLNEATYSWEHPLPVRDFYDHMRNGSLPTTSQANPEEAKALFEQIIREQDADILHIAFSSGLSGSYNSSRIAANELLEEYPKHRIIVIDSLCASLGEGLLVHKAVCLKEQGSSLDETAAWLEENKLHLVHNFTVDDLFHLYRGGRVSKTAAFVGTMINLKPILHVDDEGHLIPLAKVRAAKSPSLRLSMQWQNKLAAGEIKMILFLSATETARRRRSLSQTSSKNVSAMKAFLSTMSDLPSAHIQVPV